MRPKRRAAEVPPDLVHYDAARWEAWAAERHDGPAPLHWTAQDGYRQALADAGVAHDVAADLCAREFTADIRRRLAADNARGGT